MTSRRVKDIKFVDSGKISIDGMALELKIVKNGSIFFMFLPHHADYYDYYDDDDDYDYYDEEEEQHHGPRPLIQKKNAKNESKSKTKGDPKVAPQCKSAVLPPKKTLRVKGEVPHQKKDPLSIKPLQDSSKSDSNNLNMHNASSSSRTAVDLCSNRDLAGESEADDRESVNLVVVGHVDAGKINGAGFRRIAKSSVLYTVDGGEHSIVMKEFIKIRVTD